MIDIPYRESFDSFSDLLAARQAIVTALQSRTVFSPTARPIPPADQTPPTSVLVDPAPTWHTPQLDLVLEEQAQILNRAFRRLVETADRPGGDPRRISLALRAQAQFHKSFLTLYGPPVHPRARSTDYGADRSR